MLVAFAISVSVNNNHIWDYLEDDDYYQIDLTNSEYGCCYGWVCMKHCQHFNVYQFGYNFYHHWWGDGRLCFGKFI